MLPALSPDGASSATSVDDSSSSDKTPRKGVSPRTRNPLLFAMDTEYLARYRDPSAGWCNDVSMYVTEFHVMAAILCACCEAAVMVARRPGAALP